MKEHLEVRPGVKRIVFGSAVVAVTSSELAKDFLVKESLENFTVDGLVFLIGALMVLSGMRCKRKKSD